MTKPRRRAKPDYRHGEQVLADLESVTIILENGRRQRFRIDAELSVSDDPVELHAQALTAHARYAFWSYQADRALQRLREAEAAHAKIEGETRYAYARTLKDEDRYTSHSTVEGLVSSDPKVETSKKHLNDVRGDWSILRTVAGALDHRAHLLRRLLAKDHDAITSE